jgi:hypothetical protein
MPALSYAPSLMAALSEVADPRQPRGVRHPFSGILALALLGLIGRIHEFAALQRWAASHWRLLKQPLGFTRGRPPHATTLSRTLAKFSLAEFQTAFSHWLAAMMADQQSLAVAADGKTRRQGFDAHGDPVQMLNLFVQDVKACLGQWPLGGDKSTEPEALKAHLSELFERYPALRLITGDALYAQRNLAELIVASGHDYLFQLKGNQPDALDAAQTCLAAATDAEAAAKTVEKKGAARKLVFFGSTWKTPTTSEIAWVLPVARCSSASSAGPKTAKAARRAKRATSSRVSTPRRSRPANC